MAEQSSAKDYSNGVVIQNLLNLVLQPMEEAVLLQMFAGYERVVLKAEFGGGFGGGRVFLLRPITKQGAELPTVVKLGPASIILKEWEAYTGFVERKVPKVAQVDGKPIFSHDGLWGGIRYPLAGDGRFYIESLGQFCQHASGEDAAYVLTHRLFPSIGVMWQEGQVAQELFFGGSFDPILPVNLFIRCTANVSQPIELNPQSVRHQKIGIEDEVAVINFVVTEVDETAEALTLDLPRSNNKLPNSFRLRLTAVANIGKYHEGQTLTHPITGMVQATRYTLLKAQVERSFAQNINLTAGTVMLPGMDMLPNPLAALPHILEQSCDLRVGPIHGDLNLENILIEYDQKSRDVYLIDFANARYDCVLHDLLRLESGLWLYVVSVDLAQHGRSLADLAPFLTALYTNAANPVPELEKTFCILKAVRQMAQHLLVNPQSWQAYNNGLTVYLLGALKFRNLDDLPSSPLPKQVAFTVAALLQKLSQLSPSELASTQPENEGHDSRVSNAPITNSDIMPEVEIMRQIRVLLPECEPFESQHQLRAFFAHPQLKSWRNRLPEEHRLSARVDGIIALLHRRTHAGTGSNALVLLLNILSDDPNTDEDLRPDLKNLAGQLEISLASKE